MKPAEDPRSFAIPVLRVEQPIGKFFLGVMGSEQLCEITDFDVRRLLKERDFETYLGIQRPLNPVRVKEIRQYVTTIDACFPTSIILSVSGNCAIYNEQDRTLTLSNYLNQDAPDTTILYRQIAKVIDGQHRIEGLKNYSGPTFELNVCIFVDIDVAEEGYIFSTVNLAQTKVNRSLAIDLYDLARSKSPQKLCHNVAVALDQNEGSPFYHRIKRLGVATEGRFNETLTQATFVDSLIVYISSDPVKDRDLYLRGKTPPRSGAEESKRLIFRNMMVDGRDLEIADVVWNYFDAVRSKWPGAWETTERGAVLNKTNGFRALMRFLRLVYLSIGKPGDVPKKETFERVFERIHIAQGEFNTEVFPPGTSGEGALFRRLRDESGLNVG